MPFTIKVSGLTLRPQASSNTCWFASTMMMYKWRAARSGNVPDPSANGEVMDAVNKDFQLPWAVTLKYADAIGMKPKPQMTPGIEEMKDWLFDGPLFTDGISVDWQGHTAGPGHVVVLAGLRELADGKLEVFVYDPWPVNIGHAGWRPIGHLVSMMESGRDKERFGTFLSYP